jgi:two-component system CheB/CheR fusion protein
MSGEPAKKEQKRADFSRRANKKGKGAVPEATARDTLAVTRRESFPIVGIGASAGGLTAFKRFFQTMPADAGMAFVLIQHLDPTHESLMVELLARSTAMKVVEVTDRMPVQPNQVFMIPPNEYLAIRAGVLELTEPIMRRGMRMPIDFFFRSLAEDQQEKAIGIILSGTGTDGTLGLKAIKGNGGMGIAQDPETAQYDGMPRSAIATGLVDYVMDVEKMPETLMQYARHAYINHAAKRGLAVEEAPDRFQSILGMLRARTRYDFRYYKKGTLERRIERRMALNGLEDIASYARFLKDNPGEVQQLFKDLLIGVTGFFREPEAFKVLEREVIPKLVQAKAAEEPLRVWVPGCASGEEPYSIAMLLIEQFEAVEKNCSVHIFASDIDEEALEFARAGTYPESIGADVSSERLRRFFTKAGEAYQVSKPVRECVVFAVQNLISDPPFSKLDLISCRNLLIYFESELQQKLISLFHFALNEEGYLFLGNAETVGQQEDLFEPVSKKWRVYRRIGSARRDQINFPIVPTDGKERRRLDVTTPPPGRPASLHERVQQILVKEYAPASVLINRKYEIVYFYGPTRRYLDFPSGGAVLDLIGMAQEALRYKLRAAVHRALRDDQPVTVSGARITWDGVEHLVRLTVRPLKAPDEGLLLITFEEEPPAVAAETIGAQPSGAEQSLVQQLEGALKTTQEDLQGTIEELETSNEELKASNEEVMSMNEELQSTNEELETSKEELQSLNEELATLNNELQDKVAELTATNNDLANLVSSNDIGTLFLDPQFRIKRFTPATSKLFKLIATDIGRSIADISHHFQTNHILEDALGVLQTLAPSEREVSTQDGRWYIQRIRPYRTQDDRIGGVVATFTDVTGIKRVEAELRRLTEALEQQVVQRTGHVKLLQDVAMIANQAESVEAALEAALDRVCRHLDWPVGHVYRPALRDADVFIDTGLWVLHPPEGFRKLVEASRQRTFRRGEGPVGQVVASGTPDWIPDITQYPECLRTENVANLGVHACLLFPVLVGERVVAVLEFFSSRTSAPDVELLGVIAQVGTQLGRVIERAQATDALRESASKVRALLKTAAEGIVTIDARGLIESFNPAAERIFGYNTAEVVGQNVSLLMPPPYRNEHDRYIADYLKTGQAKIIGVGREVVGLRKEGSTFPMDLAVSEFTHGTERYFAGVMRDVTERKAAEEALRQSEERFRDLVEGSIQGIYAYRDWRPLFVNRAYAEMLGYTSPEELMAQGSLEPCVAPEARPRLQRLHEALNKGEFAQRLVEFDAIRKDGETITLQCVMRPIDWAGEQAIQSTVIDVTERRRAETLARERGRELARMVRVSAVGEMGSALAHELNQPLTAIISYAEGAARRFHLEKGANAQLLNVLAQTAGLAKRAAAVVHSIREFVKKQDGRWEPVNLNEVVKEAALLSSTEARDKGVSMTLHLHPNLPPVEGSFVQLEQVVLNLIRNGIEATEDLEESDERAVTVRTLLTTERRVELTVQDSGTGVSADITPRLFDPFVSNKPKGLGMGLSISRTIVETHEGEIWASPNPDRGTTFHVALPIQGKGHASTE